MSVTQTTRPDIAHLSAESEAATVVGGAGLTDAPHLPVPASSLPVAALQAWDTDSDLEQPASATSVWGRRGVCLGLAVLWLAGMAALVASCAGWYSRDEGRRTNDEGQWTDEGQPLTQSSVLSSQSLRWTWAETGVFGGLVVLSLVTHLAFLDQIPW